MNLVAAQERMDAVRQQCAYCADLAVTNNQEVQRAQTETMPPHSLDTSDLWPDQGLNRILATFENFDTNELNEIDCLEMLLYLSSRRRDARRVAEAAIETYGSLSKIFQRPGRELREILGMDRSMTALLAIAKTSLKFILTPNFSDRHELSSYADLMDYMAIDLRGVEQEILRVIYLDTKNRIIKDEEMARGTVDSVAIYPKEVARRAA
ncbi:MAG: JAB domain-containing protein, partial [Pseudomonadota bacterium]